MRKRVLSVTALSHIRPTGPAAVMVTPDGCVGLVARELVGATVDGSQWESLSSRHGVVLWFTGPGARVFPVNRLATQLLLATSGWSAAEVPLLRGPVLLGARTAIGTPTGLSMAQFEVLNAWSRLSWRSRRTLRRRIERASHQP